MSQNMETQHLQEIFQIIRSDRTADQIRDALDDYHENDIAAVIPQLTKEERLKLSQSLEISRQADIFSYMDNAEDYLEELPDELAAEILTDMEPDDAVDFLKNTTSDKKTSWLSHMNVDDRTNLEKLAAYEENVIASRMTTNFISVKLNLTVPQVMKEVVAQAADHDNIATICGRS